MTRILFVCHGNICRSPMAEFVMKSLAASAGLEREFDIASAATSSEELGNPVYPQARRKLAEHGIGCAGKTARRMTAADYGAYDLLIGMDAANLRNMLRICGGDPDGKLHKLTEYCGRPDDDVADPWYTDDFDTAWNDIYSGCKGLLDALAPEVELDLSHCATRHDIYSVLREKMHWQDWYGENLDSLWDILTGLPFYGRRFTFRLPDGEIRMYAEKVCATFEDAGLPVSTNSGRK